MDIIKHIMIYNGVEVSSVHEKYIYMLVLEELLVHILQRTKILLIGGEVEVLFGHEFSCQVSSF